MICRLGKRKQRLFRGQIATFALKIFAFNALRLFPFPNPADKYLNVNDALKNKYFELYNLMGELVFNGKLKNELFLGNLKSGTYYLNLTEHKKVLKIIVSH